MIIWRLDYGSCSRHRHRRQLWRCRFLKVLCSVLRTAQQAFAGCSGCDGVTKAVSSGGYERLVVGKLRETALNVQVAHPRVRAFARACGYEAKTDPLDAQVLSRYGECSDTVAQPEVDPDREESGRRRQLVEQGNDKGVSASVGKSTRRHVWLDREIGMVRVQGDEAQHQPRQKELPDGTRRGTADRGHTSRISPRTWDGRALASLVGLAPWSRDSGKKRGNRSIRGGRGTVRRALYICAWVVLRIDGDLRDFYRRLRERGKPGKVATIAVARKLLMQLNAVARRGTPVKQYGPSYQAESARILLRDGPHSDGIFIKAYPAETTEAARHVSAFAFLGGCRRGVRQLEDCRRQDTGRRTSQAHEAFTELQSHYLFSDRFGRVGKGNDKGSVEGMVGYGRRNFLVPIPRAENFDELNAHLESECLERMDARLRGHTET